MTTKTITLQVADNGGIAVQADYRLTGSFGPSGSYNPFEATQDALRHAAEQMAGHKNGETITRADGTRARLSISVSVTTFALKYYDIFDEEELPLGTVEGTCPSDAIAVWCKENNRKGWWFSLVEGTTDNYKASDQPEIYRVVELVK